MTFSVLTFWRKEKVDPPGIRTQGMDGERLLLDLKLWMDMAEDPEIKKVIQRRIDEVCRYLIEKNLRTITLVRTWTREGENATDISNEGECE